MIENISPKYEPFVKHVHVETPGTLAKLIPSKERDAITTLVITGFLNSKDFDDVLDDMCRIEYDYEYEGDPDDEDDYKIDWSETPRLRTLDMGGCELVGQTNVPYFGYKSVLEHLVLPSNAKSTMESDYEESFDGCYLKSLVLPNGLIEFDGFSCNPGLKDVVIPDSVEVIGDSALGHCTSLETINIPPKAKLVGNPFHGCTSLKRFDLHPDNPYYTLVDGVLFTKDRKTLVSYPEGLHVESYTVPSFVEEIGSEAFAYTLLKEIILPECLKRVGSQSFLGADNLTKLVFPDTVEQIGFRCMGWCKSLRSVVLPAKLKEAPQQLFSGCRNLHEINFPASVKRIPLETLVWNEAFETINLPEGLEEISIERNFDIFYCASQGALKSIFFPRSLRYIPAGIFRNCSKLKSFDVHPDNPYYMTAEDGALCTKGMKELVSVPNGNRESYIVPDGIEVIQPSVFWHFHKLKDVTLPESLQKIGMRAFDSCESLAELTIPANVTTIEERVFDDCKRLTTITMLPLLPPNVEGELIAFSKSYKHLTLRVPADALSAYKDHKVWSKFKIISL